MQKEISNNADHGDIDAVYGSSFSSKDRGASMWIVGFNFVYLTNSMNSTYQANDYASAPFGNLLFSKKIINKYKKVVKKSNITVNLTLSLH